ncbi:MAG TPA: M2 family metallopeptidase [Polyangia bacterium]|jgi:peptidyl-dipeptidase A
MRRLTAVAVLALAACSAPVQQAPAPAPAPAAAAPPSRDAAVAFVRAVEQELATLWIAQQRATWVRATYITDDTEALAAQAAEAVMVASARRAQEATRFTGPDLPADVARKLRLLKLSIELPAPPAAAERTELATITQRLEGAYGKGKYCPPRLKGKCLTLDEIGQIMAKSRDPEELADLWQGWHQVGAGLRADYTRYVELANKGARTLGYHDLGEQWQSRYDMKPAELQALVDRLYAQLQPFYRELHCYTRAKLRERYGQSRVPDGPIPAHLLGNMWAQEWNNIDDLLIPKRGASSIDVTARLRAKKVDPIGMVKYAEAFFVSLGLAPLPQSFWQRSMFTRPRDRDVVCHASAWDVDFDQDLRIKMCIDITGEDFTTVHHELGHNYYQVYYRNQPILFRDSANDGFHEALGDTIALSITPAYLARVGLIDAAHAKPSPDAELNELMQRALEKIAFLPFGMLVDKWRWDVFSGKTAPADYNAAWWRLRRDLQGVAPPTARSEADFDPGAKYHVPANVPYARYFLATILQFQFHRALCRAAGQTGPLHRCSIYGSQEAGRRLAAMMAMGQSRPWPEALKALTGETSIDATAIIDYFKPLQDYLHEQNKGRTCGW